MKEMIRQPDHYMSNGEETIVKIVRELGINGAIAFCKGNVIKYGDRAEYKGQKESDLKKIQEYTKMANDLVDIRASAQAMLVYTRDFEHLDSYMNEKVKQWSKNGHSLEGIL